MGKTAIQWTDETWNPITGCSKVSQGCKHCYAERLFPRVYRERKFTSIQCHEDRLMQPLHWRKPRRVFVNSMGDLFHEDVPVQFIMRVFAVMAQCPQHQFQILTKRPGRMQAILRGKYFPGKFWDAAMVAGDLSSPPTGIVYPLSNVWLGTSVEDQQTADERIPWLLETPATLRFVSYEPALGPVDFEAFFCTYDHNGESNGPRCNPDGSPALGWVIVGGESGPYARPMHPDWARSLRDQCVRAGVPFFFKQWGAYVPREFVRRALSDDPMGETELLGWQCAASGVLLEEWDDHIDIVTGCIEWAEARAPDRLKHVAGRTFAWRGLWLEKVASKAAAPRGLDGRVWDQWPA